MLENTPACIYTYIEGRTSTLTGQPQMWTSLEHLGRPPAVARRREDCLGKTLHPQEKNPIPEGADAVLGGAYCAALITPIVQVTMLQRRSSTRVLVADAETLTDADRC